MDSKKIIEHMKNHKPSILGNQAFKEFSVLIPLIEKEDELHVLFEVRSLQMRRQPGEICFPGGKVDPKDQKVEDTAIRETMEELRVTRASITNVYPFDYMVSPFGTIVFTFAGFLNGEASELNPNPDEVEEVFTVPLSFFKENHPEIHHVNFNVKPDDTFPFDLIPNGRDYDWSARAFEEYFYRYEDKVIWGMTARILYHFVEKLKEID
ncbi:NUDIX hydrolase [Pseudalkalibacillus berkeleyi]|uniref:CoA pyrophosphatase n=1 Tax=Pseudalkalibacillus berkeleyi TaxID=1069813 RepID=A0ABS9H5A4_9BACL|nr:CoA pyrophosphatase [Pseudalkalibacillus berkeleyi]MCF6139071.1 CoA pyrophosphatase [Pseudalkalibacillus berkeleyi]